MNDVRRKALERAKARQAAPPVHNSPGSPEVTGNMAFASERERAKAALRAEINSYNGLNVQKIAATATLAQPGRKLRVAAYCRVSTDDIDQVVSIELQRSNYKTIIENNPDWIYHGTYVDDGFSGTNTDHRPAFQLMMKHAEQGKFDMIITKSVSRFARNLVDCITWVRALQEHNPPIAVYFEQEGINTMVQTNNIILFVLAMVAEEESHMKSEAMLLSLEWRFSRGRVLQPRVLGYDKIIEPDGNGGFRKYLQINEDEARTVRMIYYMIANGESLSDIAATLTDLERPTGGRKKGSPLPNTEWTPNAVRNVARNEKYCGDILARKTWTPDFHTHKSRKNRGDKHKYYVANHHPAIVPRALWNAVQRILNSNRYRRKGTYLPMRVIDHGILCGYISMNRRWAGFPPEEYERISSIAMGQAEGSLDANLENEELPDGGFAVKALSGEGGVLRIARHLTQEEQRIKAQMEGREELPEIPKVKPGFQVVDGSMFSHSYDPVVRFTRSSIAFNSTCISRLNQVISIPEGLNLRRIQYVEFLFNPIERMVAIRPCEKDHPNAIRWADDNGRSIGIGATALCRIIFSVMNWDEDYSFRVPANALSHNGQSVIFFDLDNFIGSEIGRKSPAVLEPEDGEPAEVTEENENDEGTGIFYGADDEPQSAEEIAEIERRLAEIAEIEKQHFGTPLFEHAEDVRMPDYEGEWDLMAEARPLDEDHRIDETVVDALQEELLDSMR